MNTAYLAGAFALALALPAFAQPTGLKTVEGAMADAAGKPLYTYDKDTMVGMSHCTDRCAVAWPPFMAPADAKASGDWTLVTRAEGKQWAYKGKPLYTFVRDTADAAGKGEAVAGWKLAKQ